MATLIQPDGSTTPIPLELEDSVTLTLQRLYQLLDCRSVEAIRLHDGRIMWIDEDGKRKGRPLNPKATAWLQLTGRYPGDYIVGPVVIANPSESGDAD